MPTKFQLNDPSLESQWRALILFGKNSATYKFAFAKALLDLVEEQKTKITLAEMAIPFADSIVDHLRKNDKQGNAASSTFLKGCREYIYRTRFTKRTMRKEKKKSSSPTTYSKSKNSFNTGTWTKKSKPVGTWWRLPGTSTSIPICSRSNMTRINQYSSLRVISCAESMSPPFAIP